MRQTLGSIQYKYKYTNTIKHVPFLFYGNVKPNISKYPFFLFEIKLKEQPHLKPPWAWKGVGG